MQRHGCDGIIDLSQKVPNQNTWLREPFDAYLVTVTPPTRNWGLTLAEDVTKADTTDTVLQAGLSSERVHMAMANDSGEATRYINPMGF